MLANRQIGGFVFIKILYWLIKKQGPKELNI